MSRAVLALRDPEESPMSAPFSVAAPFVRPRRSLLYVPAANPRALEQGRDLLADGLILDLEDSIAPDAKDMARRPAVEAIRPGGHGQRGLRLRVTGPATPWGAPDLAAAAAPGPAGLL